MLTTQHATEPASADSRGAVATSISVVIPCRNEEGYIQAVLDAIRAQDLAPDEVIVVDGACTDRTIPLVHEYTARHPDFSLRIVPAHGATISAALNTGIAACRSDVIVRMDAHSRPAAEYLRRALHALNETDAVVVGGIWQTTPGGPGRQADAIARAVAHPMGAGDAAYRLGSRQLPGRRPVDTVPFGCFRRSHWRRIGGYNEELLINEDYEFNYRSRQSGGTVILDTTIRCEYFARPSLAALARQYFRYGWWKGRMLRQHPRSIRLRQAIPAVFVPTWILLGIIAAVFPPIRPVAAALLALYGGALLWSARQAARGDWSLTPRVAAAFLTIHTAWSAGISSFLLTGASVISRRHPGLRRARPGLTGMQLTLALAGIGVLGLGAPWAMATRLHAGRLALAAADVQTLAAAAAATDLLERGSADTDVVLVGPGTNPKVAPATGWGQARALRASLTQLSVPVTGDPWGNHYLIFPESQDPSPRGGVPPARWVLSAGPNGILETLFRQPAETAVLGGDDIGARIENK